MPLSDKFRVALEEYIASLDDTKVQKEREKIYDTVLHHCDENCVLSMEDIEPYVKTEDGIKALETLDQEVEGSLLKDVRTQILQDFFAEWEEGEEDGEEKKDENGNVSKKMFLHVYTFEETDDCHHVPEGTYGKISYSTSVKNLVVGKFKELWSDFLEDNDPWCPATIWMSIHYKLLNPNTTAESLLNFLIENGVSELEPDYIETVKYQEFIPRL